MIGKIKNIYEGGPFLDRLTWDTLEEFVKAMKRPGRLELDVEDWEEASKLCKSGVHFDGIKGPYFFVLGCRVFTRREVYNSAEGIKIPFSIVRRNNDNQGS